MTTYYSKVEDMLLGDLTLAPDFDAERYVRAGFEEINGRLGYVYELPIEVDPDSAGALVLKKINNFLASGRLILAQAIGGEDNGLQTYGQSLIRQAYADLTLVLDGVLPLEGATLHNEGPGGPTIKNRDDVSAVEAFEDMFFNVNPLSAPGFNRSDVSSSIWAPGS